MNKDRETIIIVRRKKVHGHAHHGGAWKVAFADFMTSMMALFLVLWLITQSSDVKSAIAGYFQDPLGRADEFGSSIIPGEGAQAASTRPISETKITELRRDRLQILGEEIESALSKTTELGDAAKHVEVEMTEEGLRIQLLEDSTGIFFEIGSAIPSPLGVAMLGMLGQHLSVLPQAVVVDGYTDAAPLFREGGTYTNWELSADRANTARRILVAGGLRDRQVVEVRGHADRDLRAPDQPTAPANRRVTITMLFEDAPSVASR
jgi:chemotaxis protein MotB